MLCPSCWKSEVEVPVWSFKDTTVSVEVCKPCQESGLLSIEMKVSGVMELEKPSPAWAFLAAW